MQCFIEVLKEVLTNLTQYMQSKNNMTAREHSKSDNVKAREFDRDAYPQGGFWPDIMYLICQF